MNVVIGEMRRLYDVLNDVDNIIKAPSLPPLGEAVGDLDMFVAGEAEVDEPLAVKKSRRLLQQRNTPLVVLDQVVVGGDNLNEAFLL